MDGEQADFCILFHVSIGELGLIRKGRIADAVSTQE